MRETKTLQNLSGDNWLLGEGKKPSSWIKAHVPGNIQYDLWQAGIKPDPYFGTNAEAYRDTESKFWTYKCIFDVQSYDIGLNYQIIFEGVDYKSDFYLNGKKIGSHEGMFGEIVYTVTRKLKNIGNELRVIIYPLELSPRESRAVIDPLCPERNDGRWMVKSLMSFNWDFAPRFVPTGIWKDVKLVVTKGFRFSYPRTDFKFSDDYQKVNINFLVHADSEKAQVVKAKLKLAESDNGPAVLTIEQDMRIKKGENTILLNGTLDKPRLWWPNGTGEPYLYNATCIIESGGEVIDRLDFPVGIRSFEMIRTRKDQHEQIKIPAPSLKNETMFVVNGKPIYYRGINYVPMDIIFGRIDDNRIEKQMKLVRDANVNLLRIWGGGIVNRDLFYYLADKYGIMLWHEFPLGCTDHSGNVHYQEVLHREVSKVVRKLRHHPSIVLWCGGNELFQPHSGMAPTDSIIRMLNSICYELDPERPFIPTSPYHGVFHGPYTFDCYGQGDLGGRCDHVQFCNNAPDGAYNEAGVVGPSHTSVILKSIPENEIWPPKEGGSWQYHKGFKAWSSGDTWLCKSLIEDYFGNIDNLDDLCRPGQFLQAIGLQYLCEEMRRRWPDVPGTMPWCFNYPWTAVTGSCVVAYPDLPLPAYYTLQKAYKPHNVSARFQHFVLIPGETCEIKVFCSNDSLLNVPQGSVTVSIAEFGANSDWFSKNLHVPEVGSMARSTLEPVSFQVPQDFSGVIHLKLKWDFGSGNSENEYWFGIGKNDTSEFRNPNHCFNPLLKLWTNNAGFRLQGMA